jgi:SAM-dependent methyltransferase
MIKGKHMDFKMLDVGCGIRPKGDVNIDFFRGGLNPQIGDQIQGEFMSPQKIKNFIIADAEWLPFRDDSFDVVFSSHTIEHVQNPLLMLREMCRVAKRKVIVRCPHRKGSGAVMPYHINYFDEDWFKKTSDKLGVKARQFVTAYDYPITNKFKNFCPRGFLSIAETSLPWRGIRHFERSMMRRGIFHTPFEIEVWVGKKSHLSRSEKLNFVVVYDNPITFSDCFASSPYISQGNTIAIYNLKNESLPAVLNRVVKEHISKDVWFAFCHQDFILKEDLRPRLKGKEVEAIYGPIGIRLAENRLSGMIIQANGTPLGRQLEEDTPVQTLDEICMIAHSEAFRQGLSFDERFRFHFYGADFCVQAYASGFDVLAMQLKCQHESRTIHGDITSPDYLSSLNMFREKWKQFLPIRTTTKIIT